MMHTENICTISGRHLSPCSELKSALEYYHPTPKAKGLFFPERVNLQTHERGTDIIQLHSGSHVGRGVALNFCPFCGKDICTWVMHDTND